jgi:hypothetical protein
MYGKRSLVSSEYMIRNWFIIEGMRIKKRRLCVILKGHGNDDAVSAVRQLRKPKLASKQPPMHTDKIPLYLHHTLFYPRNDGLTSAKLWHSLTCKCFTGQRRLLGTRDEFIRVATRKYEDCFFKMRQFLPKATTFVFDKTEGIKNKIFVTNVYTNNTSSFKKSRLYYHKA